MTKSTITRERLGCIASWRAKYSSGHNVVLPAEEAEELARIALAAMDSEPVAYAWISRSGKKHLTRCEPEQWRDAVIVTPLYRHAQPAPVVPDEIEPDHDNTYDYVDGWNACLAAMLQAEPVMTANKLPETQYKQVADLYEMQFDDGRTCAFHTDAEKAVQWLNTCDGNKVQEYVKLERLHDAVSGNSPVIPDGYVMVPKVPTEDMIVAGFESEPDEAFSEPEVWEEYQNMSGCQQAAHRARLCWAAMLAAIPPAPKN